MPARSRALDGAAEDPCAILRALSVLSDAWTVRIVREVLLGRRTFAELAAALDIATNVLSDRLSRLVEHGVLERRAYREPGQRTRDAYSPTAAGHDLVIVLRAMQQWGEQHLPSADPPRCSTARRDFGAAVRLVFVDGAIAEDDTVAPADVEFRAAARSSTLSDH